MLESEIAEINEFINSCDKDFYNDIYDKEKISVARKYYQRIKQVIEYDKNAYFVYIDNNLYRVEKVTQNNTSVYKVISDKKLDDLYDSSKIYKNTIKIQYDDVTGRNYIVPYDAEFIVDESCC